MNQYTKLTALCMSCKTLLGSLVSVRKASTNFEPGRVLVVQKRSRLDYERSKGNFTDAELSSRLSEMGSDYQKLLQRHEVHHRSIDQVLTFLQSKGIPLRVQCRSTYKAADVKWADTIFSLGGDGNFLFTASKVLSPEKLVIGLNTDTSSSEGYLCLPSSREVSMTSTLEKIFCGQMPQIQRTRIRVCVGKKVLPVRALNEVYMGERSLSQAFSYELSFDDSVPERQKSSGVIVYTGSGSTSWAYNMNQLTVDEVSGVLSLAREESLLAFSEHQQKDVVQRITRCYNAGNVFKGWEDKMAFVVREPIVRGLFAADKIRGNAQTLQIQSNSGHACLYLDGDFQFELPRGTVASLSIHPEDRLSTLDTTRINDCFS